MTDTTWTPTDEQVRIAAEAMEDAALEFIGRDRRVGPGDIARAALVAVGPHIAAQALRDAAADMDAEYEARTAKVGSYGQMKIRAALLTGAGYARKRADQIEKKGDDR